MGKIKWIRLSSATLVETIIAMVLILVIFGITTTVLMQTGNVSLSTKEIRARYAVNKYALQTEKEKSFFDEQKEVSLFTIQKRIQESKFNKNLVVVQFSVIDPNGNLINSQKRIFRIK